ncbi:hypothetical protein FACS18949_01270 [Clostridia bacterium]|nr:hypothetical protein FACS18949_01270 [Clostridia bacterium]
MKRLLAATLALLLVLCAYVPGFAAGDAAVSANDDAELAWYYAQTNGGELNLTNAVSTDSMLFAVNALSWNANSISYYTTRKRFSAVASESDAMIAECLAKAKAVVAEVITPGMTRYDQYLALHDWVVNNTVYDGNTLKEAYRGQTAWDAMINGRAVCNGYAKAYKLLCDTANLPNIFMTGKAGDENHAWNLVACGGEWLCVDTTWDDPVPYPGGVQTLRHDYFMLTESEISTDHKAYLSGDRVKKLETLAYPDREDVAEILNARGLFAGTGSGYDLLVTPKRDQGAVMFMKMLGYTDVNRPKNLTHPFTDIPYTDWASDWVALMYQEGYTKGYGDTFGRYDDLSLNQYLTFTLKALGYSSDSDFKWTEADSFAVKQGILSQGEADAINKRGMKRGDMALISYRVIDDLSTEAAA